MAGQFSNSSYLLTLLLLTLLVLSVWEEVVDGAAARGKRKNGRRGRCSGGGAGKRRKKRGNDLCSSHSMAEYKLTFYGTWSKEKFPRMYPTVRPPAQWSKLVGRSHAPAYQMWKEGGYADPALQKFAEQGDSLLYDSQPQGYHDVYDTFSSEALTGGEGKTSTFFLADGAHPKVSFAVKMIPSPDWFVGLDGLDLCRRGRWRVRAHVNLKPMDAGTDRGYTFTSPNWPSVPREPIYRITSSYPDHPASAFLYPEYRKLPRVAYVDVERVAQYHRKGGVSKLKSERGSNIVVFGGKTTTTTTPASAVTSTATTTAATTATPTPKTTTRNGSRLVGAGHVSDGAHSMVESGSVMRTLRPAAGPGNRYKATEHVKTAFQQTPEPAGTQILESTKSTPPRIHMTAPTRLDSAEGNSESSETVDNDEEGVQLKTRENSFKVGQNDDARAKGLNKHHQISSSWQVKTSGDRARESYPKPNSADRQKEDSTNYDQTPKNTHNANIGNESPSARSPLVHLPEGHNPDSTSSTSVAQTSKNETSDSETFQPRTDTTITTSTTTTRRSDGRKDSESDFRQPLSGSNLSAMLTSPRTIDTTKAAPQASSDPTPAEPQSTSPSVVMSNSRNRGRAGRPQMRTGTYLRRRPGRTGPSARTQPRKTSGTVEPDGSQSEHTFEEPQFPSVAATRPFRDTVPVDCEVGAWATWTPCSKTCGFGVRTRAREVLSHSENGGFACPLLRQETLCGSMRQCRWKHFSFLGNSKRPRKRPQQRMRYHRGQHPETSQTAG